MGRTALHIGLALLLLVLTLGLAYRFVPVPITPLMVIRLFQGQGFHKTWVPLSAINPSVPRAVVAAEDGNFCTHSGIDWHAVQIAYDDWMQTGNLRGGSTISQQTAKNVWLWPNSDPFRKALEIPLTYGIESAWGKRRILEVYLNVAEWGPGVYGIQAAAQHHFHTSARNLTARQAALLAATLPSPLRWSASHPGPYVRQRAGLIQARAAKLGPLPCLKK
ncbi:MAG: monofunctional biosynthetic peptidoglycan transglycosylase [Proteobacteria bacterium]|nr:monofunctional biosynthetic peptidoglycan transglycosylase [Pseudomonadota bacterium]